MGFLGHFDFRCRKKHKVVVPTKKYQPVFILLWYYRSTPKEYLITSTKTMELAQRFFLYPKNYRVILENSSESSEMRIWNFELETSNRQWIETMTLVWIIIHFTFSGYMDVNGAEIHQQTVSEKRCHRRLLNTKRNHCDKCTSNLITYWWLDNNIYAITFIRYFFKA